MRLSREQTVLKRIAPISSKTNLGYISYTKQEGNKSNSAGSTESKLGRLFPHLYKQIGSAFFPASLLLKLRCKLEAENSNKTDMSNLQKLQKCWKTSWFEHRSSCDKQPALRRSCLRSKC